tara:strand:- start:181 stop:474 length:294 start_codon:yes stop_codon:yes gene_type:complete
MKISCSEDFYDLVSSLPELLEAPEIKVFMSLRAVLNRGCKCNKKKKQEQLEKAYRNIVNKYKSQDGFIEIILEHLQARQINEISFLFNEELITSIKK